MCSGRMGRGIPFPSRLLGLESAVLPQQGPETRLKMILMHFIRAKPLLLDRILKNLVKCCFLSYLSDIKANIG